MVLPSLLSLLLACADEGAGDSAAPLDSCTDPEVAIVSPERDETFLVDEEVTLVADGEGVGALLYTWAVDGDAFTTGSTGTYIAADPGHHVLTVQLEDDCGVAQDDLNFRVAEVR